MKQMKPVVMPDLPTDNRGSHFELSRNKAENIYKTAWLQAGDRGTLQSTRLINKIDKFEDNYERDATKLLLNETNSFGHLRSK